MQDQVKVNKQSDFSRQGQTFDNKFKRNLEKKRTGKIPCNFKLEDNP